MGEQVLESVLAISTSDISLWQISNRKADCT